MDSLTQIVLGASVAALAAPQPHRRAALLAGAILGTLPDLDVLPLALIDDPIARMTWHRSVSHSIWVLLTLGLLLGWVARRWIAAVRAAPGPWLAAILLALGTHPLLDAHTVYGTQWLWPLPLAPTMWSTIFIIDPLYTLPLLVGVVVAGFARAVATARRGLWTGVLLSTVYLGWTWSAKALVDHRFDRALLAHGLRDAPRFSVPMPFTSVVWRAVALTPDGYVEAITTPWHESLQLCVYRIEPEARAAALTVAPSAQRLMWFANGFVRADARDGLLVLSDLRMGLEPDYFFRFVVAERDAGSWRAVLPRQRERPPSDWTRLREAWSAPWSATCVAAEKLGAKTHVGSD
jgi:inner membrane protein